MALWFEATVCRERCITGQLLRSPIPCGEQESTATRTFQAASFRWSSARILYARRIHLFGSVEAGRPRGIYRLPLSERRVHHGPDLVTAALDVFRRLHHYVNSRQNAYEPDTDLLGHTPTVLHIRLHHHEIDVTVGTPSPSPCRTEEYDGVWNRHFHNPKYDLIQ